MDAFIRESHIATTFESFVDRSNLIEGYRLLVLLFAQITPVGKNAILIELGCEMGIMQVRKRSPEMSALIVSKL